MQITEMTKKELSTYPVRLVAKPTTPQKSAILELMQQVDHLLGIEDQWDRAKIKGRTHRTMLMKVARLRPKT